MSTPRRLGQRLMGLVLGVLASAAVSAQVPIRRPTAFPRLSGGFGRPRDTPFSAPAPSAPSPAPSAPSPAASAPLPAPIPNYDRLGPGDSLSFDTKGYDWSTYAAEMITRKIGRAHV